MSLLARSSAGKQNADTGYSRLLTERHDRVLVVRLHNPPHTLISREMLGELHALVTRVERDSGVGAVVITGSEPGIFATHYDVKEILGDLARVPGAMSYRQARVATRVMAGLTRVPVVGRLLLRSRATQGMAAMIQTTRLFERMNASSKVYIAAINGLALGTGCIVPLACDLRLMADGDFGIGLIEMNLGFLAGIGGAQRLVRAVGVGRALPLLLEGTVLTPAEAAEVGLVHRVVEAESLIDEAIALGQRLAQQSPLAIRETKRAVYDLGTRQLHDGLVREQAGLAATMSSEVARRTISAYAEEFDAKGQASNAEVIELYERLRHGEIASKIN